MAYQFENKDLKKWWKVLNGESVDFFTFENRDLKDIVETQASKI